MADWAKEAGRVYYGLSHSSRPLAIKVIRAEYADSPEFRARFAREVAAMRQVGGFWTASVVDADADTQAPRLATEFIAGPTLRAALSAGPLEVETCRALLVRLSEALHAIHDVGLIHRDMKPGNVILAHDGPRRSRSAARHWDRHRTCSRSGRQSRLLPVDTALSTQRQPSALIWVVRSMLLMQTTVVLAVVLRLLQIRYLILVENIPGYVAGDGHLAEHTVTALLLMLMGLATTAALGTVSWWMPRMGWLFVLIVGGYIVNGIDLISDLVTRSTRDGTWLIETLYLDVAIP